LGRFSFVGAMMRDCDVVVLSRFPEIFEGFRESVDRDAPETRKIVVWDALGENPSPIVSPWESIFPDMPFHMSINANRGWMGVRPDRDILYAGDDTRIIEPDTIKRLQAIAYSDPAIGILSPKILGNCCMEAVETFNNPVNYLQFVGFVFVYIKREVIEKVGYLDERFTGYGFEDIDYCYRVRKAGFKIAMTNDVTVKHGVNGHTYGSTFMRTTGEEQMGKQNYQNLRIFAEKWGLDPNDATGIFAAIRDLSATERS